MNLYVNIDGACKGNPGPSGIGIVFSTSENRIIREDFYSVGEVTNNVAEYMALIKALEILNNCDINYRHIVIRTDSLLVANQMNRKYRVSNRTIKKYYDMAVKNKYKIYDRPCDKIQPITVTINHIPREQNALADKLANQGVLEGELIQWE